MFMWRSLSNIVPVASTLISRGMKVDSHCQHCGSGLENTNHILFLCHVARQVWALSKFTSPVNEFHPDSLYVNFHYLFQMSKNIKIPLEIRRCYPWILWFLWKNGNKLLFEGSEYNAMDIFNKAFDEAAVWFATQELDKEGEKCDWEPIRVYKSRWIRPAKPWKKCSYGLMWSRKKKILGAGWIVRDHNGDSLLHSRRTFADIRDLQEAKLRALSWTLESMASHRLDKVISAGEDASLLKVIKRPQAWPSFSSEYQHLKKFLGRFNGCKAKLNPVVPIDVPFSLPKVLNRNSGDNPMYL